MKFLKTGLCLAVGASTMTFAITGTPSAADDAAAKPAAGETSVTAKMRAAADGAVRISKDQASGKVGFVAARGADADLLPGVEATDAASAASKAETYLNRFGTAFGVGSAQLARTGTVKDNYGWVVSFEQRYRDVPVFGGTVKASLDDAGDLRAISAFAAPDLADGVDLTPSTTAAEAGQRAVSLVRSDPPTGHDGEAADTTGIQAVSPELVLYRTGALRGVDGPTVLAYVVEVTNRDNVRDMVVLDAETNKPVNRWSTIHGALERELYEESPKPADLVWSEGEPTDELNDDQKNLVDSAGESYWMFENTFARDSYDGDGATMKTVNNDPTISCPNANWNGNTTNYCDGVTSDDVVSHEWGHAYTEYTSGLIYQYQPGALNESYSDVWGETLDMVNGREDEDEQFETLRVEGECGDAAPPALEFEITAPATAAGPCFAIAATGAKAFTTTAVTSDLVVGTDPADAAGPTTTDGCTAFTNAAAVSGTWVYVDRGTCGFAAKVANAKTAGATGIVIGNNNADIPAGFSGDAALYGAMVGQADGDRIKAAGTVSVSVTAEDVSDRAVTTRWLMGEKSTAFGGAIRDMWSPTCYGDPGKVSDAEYKCDPLLTDSGGVHSNSGVPNRAYALVVDGVATEGQTAPGIGLDKAAAIWWRAQSTYLTPTSKFADAADAWEQSCADLVGKPIFELSTTPNATPAPATPIATADCATVTAAIAATEMRAPAPERCNFGPLLAKNTPSLCGAGFKTKTIWSENFEDGLAGWERDQELADLPAYQGGIGAPWRGTESAPGGRTGGVAYGPAPDRGECSGDGVSDFSSRDTIISPTITMPAGANAKFSFDHYVATEAGYDGGNLKISVNEGRFNVVPSKAYAFNENNTTLTSVDAGGTNPLAGQEGFSGTDGGEVYGTWGTSIVNLSALGIKPGNKIRLRFDIGRDGCGGIDGWYLDNLKITTCDKVAAAPSSSTTKATAPKTKKFTKNFKVRAVVTKKSAGAAQGKVKAFVKGKQVGVATLRNGRATITVKRNIGPGRVTLRVRYAGNATTKASSDTVRIRIVR